MPYALRMTGSNFFNFTKNMEIISNYWGYIDSYVPIPNYNHFEHACRAKNACLQFGIKANKRCNPILTPMNDVNWNWNDGYTLTGLHAYFDTTSNCLERYV